MIGLYEPDWRFCVSVRTSYVCANDNYDLSCSLIYWACCGRGQLLLQDRPLSHQPNYSKNDSAKLLTNSLYFAKNSLFARKSSFGPGFI